MSSLEMIYFSPVLGTTHPSHNPRAPCLDSVPWPPPLASCQTAGIFIPRHPIIVQPSLAPPYTFQKEVTHCFPRTPLTQALWTCTSLSPPVLLSVASLSLNSSLFVSGKTPHSPSCHSNNTASWMFLFLRVHWAVIICKALGQELQGLEEREKK